VRSIFLPALVALVAMLAVSTPASADFNGQIILGPLGPGSVVNGDTTGATDDNDGFFSGDHIFYIWNGPDDVYAVNWPGGDLELEMTYDNTTADLDLFLYTPASLSDSGNYSIGNSGVENIIEPAAVAGTYYVVIDSENASTAGAYTLSVTPEPGALALLGLGLTVLLRRAR
jgi:hypothetical protein